MITHKMDMKPVLPKILVAIILAIGLFAGPLLAQSESESGVQVIRLQTVNPFVPDKAIKSFRAMTTGGVNFNTRSLKEQVTVLNFWFTGCGPCIKEMPMLNELIGRFEGKSVGFYAITPDKAEVVESFLLKKEFRFRHIVNASQLMEQLGVKSYPVTVVMDQKGMIRYSQAYSQPDINELTKLIEAILG